MRDHYYIHLLLFYRLENEREREEEEERIREWEMYKINKYKLENYAFK